MPLKKRKVTERDSTRNYNKSIILREIVLRHIRWSEPRPVPQIHQYVVDDYGSVTNRSVYRHIKKLIEDGEIQKVHDESEDVFGYIRIKRPRWDRAEQVYV